MSFSPRASFGLRTLLIGWVLVLTLLAAVPWSAILETSLLTGALLLPELASEGKREWAWKWGAGAACGATLLLCASIFCASGKFTVLDPYFALLAWLIAAAAALAALRVAALRSGWWYKVLAVTWGGVGAAIWLAFAYVQNLAGSFYFGVVFMLALLFLCKTLFRLPAVGVLTAKITGK